MLEISNFVLEIHNTMKRTLLIILVALLVVATTAFWLLASESTSMVDKIHIPVIALIVLVAFFLAFQRIKSLRRGEPAEDELTRHTMLRVAAYAFYISLYWWVFLLYLKDRISFEQEELLGTGILGMAVAWVLTWLVFSFLGPRHG